MEDDSEQLDWGHDDEDSVVVHGSLNVDDVEDAVSLGGDDDDDEFLAYQSRVLQDAPHRDHSPPKSTRHQKHDPPKGHTNAPISRQSQDQSSQRNDSTDPPSSGHTLLFGPLVHALPPKPVVSTVSFVYPSHPSIIEATAMASRADRDRNGAVSKTGVPYDHNEPLPSGWELKHPRNGRGVYYYNIHTQESTWTRPIAPAIREKRGERSDRRDDSLDKPLPTRNDETLIPRVGRADGGAMSYDDRHYRPGESGRREERPAAPTQLINSYVPDSCSPNHRGNRPSPPPTRARERNPSPPPRRPLSPATSYGDRDGGQTSHREASLVSTQDRVWVARDSVPQERPRERRQRDDPSPPQIERRDPPRDTERSSTLSTLSAYSSPHLLYSARLLLPRWRTEHLAKVSRNLGSRAAPYDIPFLFLRLPRMDTRTLIMDLYLPHFYPFSSLSSPFDMSRPLFVI
ncbi:hypothetical protein JVU11DRAFT_8113 [Chiua virens]|nr:hypothetical protein JVU11DRAFT_8113 [Chiua virens]